MSISARLYVEDKEYNILYLNISMSQDVDKSGKPIAKPVGGYFDIDIETTKDNTILDWMLKPAELKDAKIVIPSRFGTSKSQIYELKDVYCIEFANSFTSITPKPMTTSFRLSPGGMYQNGDLEFIKHWHKPKPVVKLEPYEKEDKEKKVILSFLPINDEAKNGKYGYDKFDEKLKDVYTGKDFSKFENEYNPIQVYGEKYYPVWVSMRQGQTITLDIATSKTKNPKLFDEIKFVENPDFTFEPANLKGVSKVNITCNNSGSQTQIKVEGDGEVVGAINIFYPEPKEINVRWVVVNFNKGDRESINDLIDLDKLKKYFKSAFNPTIIDINIVNEIPEIFDITLPVTNPVEQALVKKIKTYIEADKKDSVKQDTESKTNIIEDLNTLHLQRQKRIKPNEVTLYLTNLKSGSQKESAKDSEMIETASNNGGTIRNLSLMYLGNDKQLMKPPVEIPHEVMHAMGLPHSFIDNDSKPKKHTFKITETKNYMDYNNTKETTFFWQWELLH